MIGNTPGIKSWSDLSFEWHVICPANRQVSDREQTRHQVMVRSVSFEWHVTCPVDGQVIGNTPGVKSWSDLCHLSCM